MSYAPRPSEPSPLAVAGCTPLYYWGQEEKEKRNSNEAVVAAVMFQWDVGNIDKNLRHGVHDWEIEEALLDPGGRRVGSTVVSGEERYIWLGRAISSGKYLRVVYTLRPDAVGQFLFRPISAVEMSAPEKRRYRRK